MKTSTMREAGRIPVDTLNDLVGDEGLLHDFAYRIVNDVPIPAPKLPLGILHVVEHDKGGHLSWLLGGESPTGWWYYFPVAIAVKTPLPLLVLFAAGTLLLIRDRRDGKAREAFFCVVIALALLLVAMTARINIGIRHVLPLFPLMTIPAAYGAMRIWAMSTSYLSGKLLVTLLLAWQAVSGPRWFPDHLAYFNEIAEDDPSFFLVDSNLDWGQDLALLSLRLKELNAEGIALSYFGSIRGHMHGLPPVSVADPFRPAHGWVAVSEMSRLGVGEPGDQRGHFDWLRRYRHELVGSSIRLYYVPPPRCP